MRAVLGKVERDAETGETVLPGSVSTPIPASARIAVRSDAPPIQAMRIAAIRRFSGLYSPPPT